jgi:molybdopterin converting factor subunit 1
MVVNILAFGVSKDIFEVRTLALDVGDNCTTVHQLRTLLNERYPALVALKTYMLAVDNEYASAERTITSACEIALIPPVSGG